MPSLNVLFFLFLPLECSVKDLSASAFKMQNEHAKMKFDVNKFTCLMEGKAEK